MSQYLFFSGKGGVGKTTMAAATAVYYAGAGKKTLIISTDPASNLADIFERPIGHGIVDIAHNLYAMEIDPDAATEDYKEKVIGPMRGILPEDVMKVMEEQFRSACTVEIAAFDRFTDFLTNDEYDVIVFDTAPTGHTIRLLELPIDWSKHIEESSKGGGNTCLGPVSSIQGSKEKYDNAIRAMRDAARTRFYLVMKPEKTSLAEAMRAHDELSKLKILNYEIIINGIIPEDALNGKYGKMIEAQRQHIHSISEAFPYPLRKVYLQGAEVKGLENIRAFSKIVYDGGGRLNTVFHEVNQFEHFATSAALRDIITRKLDHRVIIVTGKGGVGKTVTACAMASRLAKEGNRTLLVTTDPAAHIGYVLDEKIGDTVTPMKGVPGLYAARIDQKKSVETYKAKIIADSEKAGYSDDMILALKEELESPCTEEMAVFEEFSRLISSGDFEYIVFDTAPTGHTLRLLELPYDYAKQVEMMVNVKGDAEFTSDAKKKLEELVANLKNRDYCSFFLVFYPEYTPIFEAKRSLDDLKLAGIEVQAVIANNILDQNPASEFFTGRYNMQQHYLKVAYEQFKLPMFKIKLFDEEINGLLKLKWVEEELFGNG
ncbi:MAG: TRC40/GET3/ArsA family transport-energizing ATPase [Spirochaetota bacterium]